MLDVALLGTSGMMPLPNRFLTALLCRLNGRFILIDCGEGTQVTMKMLGWGFKNLDAICFTHFHADHIAGLPGLLLTIGNSGRTEPIKVIGPAGVCDVVKSLCIIAPELPFKLEFIELNEDYESIIVGEYEIKTIFLNHRIDCYGYSININRPGKFNPVIAKKLGIPLNLWSTLQKGEEVVVDGKVFKNFDVMGDKRKGIKVSYVTDTRPTEKLYDFVQDSDLYISEGIYADDEKIEKAKEYKHMTFSEAAKIAKESNVRELWLTHFSPSLTNPEDFINVATDIFENTEIGYDRKEKTLLFE